MTNKTKKFRSASGSPIRIALLSGHITTVGNEWASLSEVFWKDAYANGCVSEDMDVFKDIERLQEAGVIDQVQALQNLRGKVREAVDKCLAEGNPENFTASKGPKAQYLNSAVGETVPAHVREEIWAEYVANGATSPEVAEQEAPLDTKI
jgi:hypothetical protein